MQELTEEEREALEKVVDLAGQIQALRWIHPIVDTVRIDPRLRKKVGELKVVLEKIKTEKLTEVT